MPQLHCISLKTGERIPMPEKTFLCLGNFDGVHLAHRALLELARKNRERLCPDAAVGVFCFRQLPARFLNDDFQGRLCTPRERLERYRDCGMEIAILAEFEELRAFSPEAYLKDVLINSCHAVAVACGFNHRFGKNGAGDIALLTRTFGERLCVQEAVTLDGAAVSSSRIRDLLQEGRVEEAARLLTVPYCVTAPVLHGKALGRKMGTPTVNQQFPADAVIPRRGVYVTECTVGGKTYRGVTNVGVRPTVEDDGRINFETYLLDFAGDLYDADLTVHFLKFLRDERKFESTEALWEQIRGDIASARAYLG